MLIFVVPKRTQITSSKGALKLHETLRISSFTKIPSLTQNNFSPLQVRLEHVLNASLEKKKKQEAEKDIEKFSKYMKQQ